MMDREYLIEAIRANPKEDTPRLMYADLLEEHGEGDRDAATAEFIRMACVMKSGGTTTVMPRRVYPWLGANWKRLVPDTLELHVPRELGAVIPVPGHASEVVLLPNAGPGWSQNGRRIAMRISLPGGRSWRNPAPPEKIYTCSCTLEFWCGFVVGVEAWSDFCHLSIRKTLLAEQPFAYDPKPPTTNIPVVVYSEPTTF